MKGLPSCMDVHLGYNQEGVLRTGTGNRICPNIIPVLVTGTGIYFLPTSSKELKYKDFGSMKQNATYCTLFSHLRMKTRKQWQFPSWCDQAGPAERSGACPSPIVQGLPCLGMGCTQDYYYYKNILNNNNRLYNPLWSWAPPPLLLTLMVACRCSPHWAQSNSIF